MEQNWDSLTTGPRKIKQTWHNTVAKTMVNILCMVGTVDFICNLHNFSYLHSATNLQAIYTYVIVSQLLSNI